MTVEKLIVAERPLWDEEVAVVSLVLEWWHTEDEDVFILHKGTDCYHFDNGKDALNAFKHPYAMATESAYVPSL